MEFGQWEEWSESRSIDWHLTNFPLHDGLRKLVQHLNWLYTTEPAFYDLDDSYEGYEWIDFHDGDNCVWSFVRKARNGDLLLLVVNATPVVRGGYRVGVPTSGWYKEILNTDAEIYGGSNVGNWGGKWAEPIEWQGRAHSIQIDLAPLSVNAFKYLKDVD